MGRRKVGSLRVAAMTAKTSIIYFGFNYYSLKFY